MRRTLPLLATLLLTHVATAQSWQDGFETYSVGSPIEGQGGWMNWLGPGANQTINTVSDDFARTGTRSVRVDAGSDTFQPFHVTSGQLTITSHLYLPATFQGRTTFILMNTHAVPSGPYNWSQEVHFDQPSDTIYFYGGNSASPIQVAGLSYDRWVELRHEIDLDLDTCDVYYDGQLVYGYSWSIGTWTNGVAEFAGINLWPATPTTTVAYWDDLAVVPVGASIGNNYCGPAVVNSTGASATMSGSGSAVVANNDLVLEALDLPLNSFAFFLTSRVQGMVTNPGGSQGNLCLASQIGRYVGSGQVQNSGTSGSISLALDLTATPTPTGLVSVAAGETWNFQAWYRDAVGGSATSNFTDGLEVLFL